MNTTDMYSIVSEPTHSTHYRCQHYTHLLPHGYSLVIGQGTHESHEVIPQMRSAMVVAEGVRCTTSLTAPQLPTASTGPKQSAVAARSLTFSHLHHPGCTSIPPATHLVMVATISMVLMMTVMRTMMRTHRPLHRGCMSTRAYHLLIWPRQRLARRLLHGPVERLQRVMLSEPTRRTIRPRLALTSPSPRQCTTRRQSESDQQPRGLMTETTTTQTTSLTSRRKASSLTWSHTTSASALEATLASTTWLMSLTQPRIPTAPPPTAASTKKDTTMALAPAPAPCRLSMEGSSHHHHRHLCRRQAPLAR